MEEVEGQQAEETQVENTPVEQTETPTSAEASPTSESEGESGPVPQKSQNRYQKLANNVRELREENQRLQKEAEALAQARGLHQALSTDPRKAQLVQMLLDQEKSEKLLSQLFQQDQNRTDPYERYEPEVAERFRKLDQLLQWQEQKEQEYKAFQEQSVAQNVQHLEDAFTNKLKQKGLVSADGKYDQDVVDLLGKATLAALSETGVHPFHANEKQLEEALERSFKGLESWSKRSLKQAVQSNTKVPASASASGGLPPQKGVDYTNQDNRLARIMSAM